MKRIELGVSLAAVLLICGTALCIAERHRPVAYEFHTIGERGRGYVVRCNLRTGDVEKLRGEGYMYRELSTQERLKIWQQEQELRKPSAVEIFEQDQSPRKSAEEILGIQAPLTSNRNCE